MAARPGSSASVPATEALPSRRAACGVAGVRRAACGARRTRRRAACAVRRAACGVAGVRRAAPQACGVALPSRRCRVARSQEIGAALVAEVVREIVRCAGKLFAHKACREVARALLPTAVVGVCVVHCLPAMRFLSELGDMVAQGGGSKRAFVRQFRAELSCALVRGNARMYAHALTNVGAPAATRNRRRPHLSAEQQLANRIQRHMQQGSISRAARALKEVPVADASDPEVLAKLAASVLVESPLVSNPAEATF